MIFTVWYLAWVLSATTFAAFLVPYLGLALRGTYLNHRFTFIRPSHVFVALAMFLGLSIVEGNELEYSGLLTLNVVAFMALFYHYGTRVGSVRFSLMPQFPAAIAFVAMRYYRLISQKRNDFEYAVRFRLPVEGGSSLVMSRRKLAYALKAILAALVDFVVLVGQLQAILNARGGLPHPKGWQADVHRRSELVPMMVGDVAFVLLLMMVAIGPAHLVVPERLRALVSGLSSSAWSLGEFAVDSARQLVS